MRLTKILHRLQRLSVDIQVKALGGKPIPIAKPRLALFDGPCTQDKKVQGFPEQQVSLLLPMKAVAFPAFVYQVSVLCPRTLR